MDNTAITALTGVVGVAAGVLTTGAVQAFIAGRDRRRAARAAARLFLIELNETRIALDLLASGTVYLYNPTRVVDAWEEGRAALALSLGTADFIDIHHAVVRVQDIARIA